MVGEEGDEQARRVRMWVAAEKRMVSAKRILGDCRQVWGFVKRCELWMTLTWKGCRMQKLADV